MSIKSTSLLIIVMCAICTFAQAQTAAASKTKAASPASICYATFGQTSPSFCVTANGNIGDFYYPNSVSQIFTDGYGVCDSTGSSAVSYYDAGVADSGNWQNPVITEPNGVNTFPLTIKRTTSDGIWTITQAFSKSTTDAYAKVVMTFKNNTAVTRSALMTRYVDIDADGYPGTNWFAGDANSGWGYNPESTIYPNHGLTVRSNSSVHNLFGYNVPSGNYDPCVINNNPLSSPTQGDEAVVYVWAPYGTGSVGAGKSITVTLEYRPM